MQKIYFKGVFSHDLKRPCQKRSFYRYSMEIDGFQINAEQNNPEPGIEGNVVHRTYIQPFRHGNQCRLKNKVGNDQDNTDDEGKPRQTNKENPHDTRGGDTVENTEIDKIFTKEKIGNNSDDQRPATNFIEPPSYRRPPNALFMSQCEAHTHTKEKERDDKSRKTEPECIFNKINRDKSEAVQIKGHVKDDH